MDFDVVIVGAGAAGLMCAMQAGLRGRRVLLLDKAAKAGEKIRISGGGRCNFTNLHATPANYLCSNAHFCKSALGRYRPADFIALIEKHRIAYHEKTLGQLFCDGSSKQVVKMLLDECEAAQVRLRLNCEVTHITPQEEGFALTTSDGDNIRCQALVIATGGPSIPKMGATDWGHRIAKQFGLKLVTPKAGLVPFALAQPLSHLAGVSCEVIASCNRTQFRESMLFTHRGLSGPAILQISSYWNEGDSIWLNLLPQQDALATLKRARQTHGRQEVQSLLAQHLPKKLAQHLCQTYQHEGRLADYNNHKLERLATLLSAWEMTPNGTEGYRTAEVTLGGVDTTELSSKTFECRNIGGLYFIGEVVDVTGWLGGYNFQWAWASGHACGQAV